MSRCGWCHGYDTEDRYDLAVSTVSSVAMHTAWTHCNDCGAVSVDGEIASGPDLDSVRELVWDMRKEAS